MDASSVRALLITTAEQLPHWLAQATTTSGYVIEWNLSREPDAQITDSVANNFFALLIDGTISYKDALFCVRNRTQPIAVIVQRTQTTDDEIAALYAAGVTSVLIGTDIFQTAAWLRTCAKQNFAIQESTQQQRYKNAMALLLDTVCQLSLARDISTIQEIVRRTARLLNGADGATFVLRDGDRCYYADENAIEPLWKGQRFPLKTCISGWAMLNRKPVAIENIYEDPRIPVDAYRPTFVKSLVMVPIRTEAPIGAIGNYWAHHHIATPEEIELIQALADSTAIAIENVQLYQQLEQRVRQRTAQLEVTNRELESFSFSVSHDLRTPLRQIEGLVEMLIDDYGGAKNASMIGQLQSVRKCTKTMKQLIDDLLNLARLGAKSLQQETIDMWQQAQEVFDEIGKQAETAVKFDLADLPTICGDAALIKQVWINLISNAIKYSSKRDTPLVTVGCNSNEFERIYFVRDNGAGFDADHAKKLFGVFQRFHSDKEFPGTGVGLSIVQRVITRHGGRVWAESKPNEGATFFFSLPINHESVVDM